MTNASTLADLITAFHQDYPFWAGQMFYIRDKKNELHAMELNHVQRRLDEIEKEEIAKHGQARIYVLKGRQGGVSTDQQARALHLVMWTPGANALTLAHSRDDTDKLFQITRRAMREMIERYKELVPTVGRSEAKEVTFPGIDSNFWTGTAGARRIGRGITLTRFHGSEFAFWDKPRQVIASVTPAMIPSGSVMVLETTPDAEGSEAHKFWQEAEEGSNGYRAVFFPWWECDPENYRLHLITEDEIEGLSEEESTLRSKFGLDLEQIKWRRQKIKEMGKLEFIREYPEDPDTCWITGGQKFYDPELVWGLLRRPPTPTHSTAAAQGGLVKVFAGPEVDTEIIPGQVANIIEDVVIGCDVAEGSGGDRSTWTARGFPSWRLLAMYASNKIDPTDLAYLLYEWGYNIYGRKGEGQEALLVVEKNQHGITTLRKLRELKYPMKSIYHRTPLSKAHDTRTEYLGWVTTGESKPLMLDAGREILRAAAEDTIGVPSQEALRDAWAVSDGELNGRDVFVSEILGWIGREFLIRRRARIGKSLHWG